MCTCCYVVIKKQIHFKFSKNTTSKYYSNSLLCKYLKMKIGGVLGNQSLYRGPVHHASLMTDDFIIKKNLCE